jgi:hypothetical protein
MVYLENSDVGVRRIDADVAEGGVERFAIVADTGTGAAFVRVQTDWRSPAELADFATRINDASTWLQEH